MLVEERKTAVILAGGLGSRLHPYTLTIPKPLLPLDGVPIIEVVARQLASHGFTRLVVSLGYLGEMIKFVLGDGRNLGVHIEYVSEDEPLGTAGALALVKDLPSTFLVMNGDLLTTLDYSQFWRSVSETELNAGVALHRRTVNVDYGVVLVDDAGRVAGYQEKPSLELEVSMGIYILRREALALLDGTRTDMPTLLMRVKEQMGGVAAFRTDAYWQDIGRLDDFDRASVDFLEDRSRFLGVSRG